MRTYVIIALLLAAAWSPLLIIGVKRGMLAKHLELRGLDAPLTGGKAQAVGLIMVVLWVAMSCLPSVIGALGLLRRP